MNETKEALGYEFGGNCIGCGEVMGSSNCLCLSVAADFGYWVMNDAIPATWQACSMSLPRQFDFSELTVRQMQAFAELGFVGVVDGDRKIVRVVAGEDCVLGR